MKTGFIFRLILLGVICFHKPLIAAEITSEKPNNETEIALSVNLNGKFKLCSAEDKGYVFLEINGGNPPYSIKWGNKEAGPFLYDLNPGSYNVTIKDNSGNQLTEKFLIQPPIPIKVTINEINHANIESGNLGSASINIQSFRNKKVKIQWCNGIEDSLEAKNLTPGTYTVKIIDEIGCDSTISFEIMNQNLITSNLESQNSSAKSITPTNKKSLEQEKSQSINKSYSKEELMRIAEEIQSKLNLAENN